MKYKDNRNMWDYIPYIVIAVCAFMIIWWSIVLNAAAEEVTPTTTYNTFTYHYKTYTWSSSNGEYAQNIQSDIDGTVTYDSSKPVCLVTTNSSNTNFGTTTNTVTYTLVSANSYYVIDSYGGHDYSKNLVSVHPVSTNKNLYVSSDLTWKTEFASYEGSAGYPAFTNHCNALFVPSGVAIANSYENAYEYLVNGDRTGIQGLPVNDIGGLTIKPEGYYEQHAGAPAISSYYKVYKDSVVLTNYNSSYYVAYKVRHKYATNIFAQRKGTMSPYVNVWHEKENYGLWQTIKTSEDDYQITADNGVYKVSEPFSTLMLQTSESSVNNNFVNYDVNGNLNSNLIFPGLKDKIKNMMYPLSVADTDAPMWCWQCLEYEIAYYTYDVNGDRIWSDWTVFTVDFPYSLTWSLLNTNFEFTEMPDGYGQTIGTVSYGSSTGNNIVSGDTIATTVGSITSGSGYDFSNAFSNSNQSLTSLSSSFNEISTFVGSVPAVMSAWFGFMPSWIWLLIALEFGFLIIFGLVKKVVG